MKRGIHIVNLKGKTKYISQYYFLFNMTSCRKPEIQNDLTKITWCSWYSFTDTLL